MKTVVVTGATSGIGYAVCERLLKSGCRVLAVGRSPERCNASEEKLRAAVPGARIIYFTADLMLLSEVRALAGCLREELGKSNDGRLDALVNNAGCVRSWYMTTQEGYEHQFALNHLAGFLLTHELLPCLLKARGRVLMTSSGSHRLMRMHWKDVMYERRYRPLMAYKQSKLCNMLTACGLGARSAGQGIRVYGVDPGLVRTDIGNKDTGGLVGYVWERRKKHGVDPSVPAEIYARIICADEAPAGLYHNASGAAAPSRAVNIRNAERLFKLSEKLCNIRFGVYDECMSS